MTDPFPHVLVVAGGTGGHIYPGMAVARALKQPRNTGEPGARITFVVRSGDIGKELLQKEDFEVIDIPGQGFPRTLSWKVVTFPLKLIDGFRQSRVLLKSLKPDLVLGMGGYLSFPVLLAAKLARVPTLIHEQNVVPGLANRLLARLADSVAVSFPESQKWLPAAKTWVAGLPIRDDVVPGDPLAARAKLGLKPDVKTLLVFGGSQGAHRLNGAVLAACRQWQGPPDIQVIHITGQPDRVWVQDAYNNFTVKGLVMPYCHDMPTAYAAADLVISRSGASTVAELTAAQRPAILIPFPFATGNHQFFNAEILQKRGMGTILLEKDLTTARLSQVIREELERQRPAEVKGDPAEPVSAARLLSDFIVQRTVRK